LGGGYIYRYTPRRYAPEGHQKLAKYHVINVCFVLMHLY